MKANKIIARMLVVLGFGGVVGLGGGCSSRAQKSRVIEVEPSPDEIIRVMYGVAPVRFDPDKPVRERVAPADTVEIDRPTEAEFRQSR